MQATRTFGGPGISRRLLAIVAALIAAFVLGAAGGYVARGTTLVSPRSGGSAAQQSLTAVNGFDYFARPKRSGLQTGGDGVTSAPAASDGVDSCALVNHHKAC